MRIVSFVLQLFGEDGSPLPQAPGLYDVVAPFLEQALGRPLEKGEVPFVLMLRVAAMAEESTFDGSLRNVTPEYGYMTIFLKSGGRMVYRHPHPVVEVISAGLPGWIERAAPGHPPVAAFALRTSDKPPSSQSTPAEIEDSVDAPRAPEAPERRDSRPGFRIRPIEEPPPPLRRRDSFAAAWVEDPKGEPTDPFVRVYVDASVHRELAASRRFSLDVEEGGFLFGRVYRDEEAKDHYLVEVTRFVAAEHTGASLLHLTFTGESFASMRRQLQSAEGDVRLIGWYHTHLFDATSSLGLSTVDLKLHFTTFRIPWQIAGLLNIDPERDPGGRVLRFYVRQQRTMVRCPHEVLG
jgi:hypothetical protein